LFLTVTPDPVLDEIFIIEEWTPGVPMRSLKTTTSVGGKGLDASVALRHLGQDTVGLAFLAGRTGQELARLVQTYGIALEAVWTGGSTRTAHIVAEARQNRHSHLFSGGIEIDAAQHEAFFQRFQQLLSQAAWVILGGIIPQALPASFYHPLIEAATRVGVPVLVDAFGDFMLEAINAHPAVVKMNRREIGLTFGEEPQEFDDLLAKASKIYRQYDLNTLVVTSGAEGIAAFTPQGVVHALPPHLQAVNAAGAGDAASAAIAWRQSLGDDWSETLRWAAAAGAAVVLTEGTADCRLEDICRIYSQVQVRQIKEIAVQRERKR
jgi:1-phosphofructokinase family hexose kinase